MKFRVSGPKLLLSVAEVVERTGLSESNVRRRLREGEIAKIKIGRKILVAEADLDRWLERHRIRAVVQVVQ